jgi:hypothetical protein
VSKADSSRTDQARDCCTAANCKRPQTWIHQLANLTLTGYNSELSNSPFEKKRKLLNESSLRMNRRIAEEERWTPAEMKARVEELWPLMRDIWPGPARQGR